MFKKAFKYQLISSTKMTAAIFFLLLSIITFFWFVVRDIATILDIDLVSNILIISIIVGFYTAPSSFRIFNQASITRKNIILVNILSSYSLSIFMSGIVLLLYVLQSRKLIIDPIVLSSSIFIDFKHGMIYSFLASILIFSLMRMSGNTIGMMFNKVTRKVGIYIGLGVFFLWPFVLALFFTWLSGVVTDFVQIVNFLEKLQKVIGYDVINGKVVPLNFITILAVFNIIACGIYYLVTIRHISKEN